MKSLVHARRNTCQVGILAVPSFSFAGELSACEAVANSAQETKGFGMIEHESGANVSIGELRSIVLQLLERAPQRLFSGVQGQLGLFVWYLRRKRGRGLMVVYNAAPLNASHRSRTSTLERSVTVKVEAFRGAAL